MGGATWPPLPLHVKGRVQCPPHGSTEKPRVMTLEGRESLPFFHYAPGGAPCATVNQGSSVTPGSTGMCSLMGFLMLGQSLAKVAKKI